MVVLPFLAFSVKTLGSVEIGKCYHGDSSAVQVGWGGKLGKEGSVLNLF